MKNLFTEKSIFLFFLFSFCLSSLLFAQKKGKSKPEEKKEIESEKKETPQDFAYSDFDHSLNFNSYEEASKNPGSVVKLDLSNQNLTSIPPDISKFSNLTVLDLSGNQIENTGTELKKLQNLKELQLANNKLTAFPSDLNKLEKLKSISLAGNNIVSLPTSIGEFKGLEMLFLQNNQIDKLPSDIGKLNSLRYLYLYGNKLKHLPVEICNLNELQVLFLQNNEISHLPHDILKLNKLIYFSVDNQKFDPENPVQLINETFYNKIPVEGLTLNKLKVFYGGSNTVNQPSSSQSKPQGMSSSESQLTSNIHGTSSSLFKTNYPPGFRPYSYLRSYFQVVYFPITGLHWLVSNRFRNKMRYTAIYRIEKSINKEEQRRNPDINKIEEKNLRRLKKLSKIG